MPQDSVSVESYYFTAVMGTRWILELTCVQHPQDKKMTTTLALAH